MSFKQFLKENDITTEIYKFLKSKGIKNPAHLKDDFKETHTYDFEYKGNKIKIYINNKDYDKVVYDFEWM